MRFATYSLARSRDSPGGELQILVTGGLFDSPGHGLCHCADEAFKHDRNNSLTNKYLHVSAVDLPRWVSGSPPTPIVDRFTAAASITSSKLKSVPRYHSGLPWPDCI